MVRKKWDKYDPYRPISQTEFHSYFDITKTIPGVSLPRYKYFTKYEVGQVHNEDSYWNGTWAAFRRFSRNERNWSIWRLDSIHDIKELRFLYHKIDDCKLYDELYQRIMYLSEHPEPIKGTYALRWCDSKDAYLSVNFRESFDSKNLKRGYIHMNYNVYDCRKAPIRDKKVAEILAKYFESMNVRVQKC